jgi:hypothetical protein
MRKEAQARELTFVIPATWDVEVRRSWFESRFSKKLVRLLHLINQ